MQTKRENEVSFQKRESNKNIIKVKCIGNNQAKLLCLTEGCTELSIFTCFNEQCKCHETHQKCYKGSVQYALRKLESKILPTQGINTQIEHTFNSIIDKISNIRDQLIMAMDQKIKLLPLTQIERMFMNVVLENQDIQLFTTIQSKILWSVIETQDKKSTQVVSNLKTQLKMYKTKEKENLQSLTKFLDCLLTKFQEEDKKLERMRRKITSEEVTLVHKFIQASSVVKSELLGERMIKFYNKKLRKLELLFRASEQKFKMKKYFQTCGSAIDTLVICQTSKGMIIGGYSPLCHESDDQGYAEDTTKSSFIFSLTNDDKFELKNEEEAIDRYLTKSCICFGDSEFLICDQANTNRNCITNINWNYSNWNYQDDDEASYLKLNGNESEYFTVKEWQVWKVQFL